MQDMRYVIHLKLANDRFKCDSACVLWLEFSIYFNFCRFRALAYATLDRLWSFFSPSGFSRQAYLCYASVTFFVFFFNRRLEQRDLRNYKTDLH